MHTINKYKKIDTVVINEMELRQEMKDRNSKIKYIMKKLANRMKLKNLIVTRGYNGSILYDSKKNHYIECPAFASNVVDKIGAGDAMLSLIALCLRNKLDKNLTMLIASLAAAQSVGTIGNKETINKTQILKSLENILK